MAISPIDISIMQRSMDVAQIQRHNDTRPEIEQANLLYKTDKDVEIKHEKVIKNQESDKSNTEADARKEGKNFYFKKEKKREKNSEKEMDGVMIKKSATSFDFKV